MYFCKQCVICCIYFFSRCLRICIHNFCCLKRIFKQCFDSRNYPLIISGCLLSVCIFNKCRKIRFVYVRWSRTRIFSVYFCDCKWKTDLPTVISDTGNNSYGFTVSSVVLVCYNIILTMVKFHAVFCHIHS